MRLREVFGLPVVDAHVARQAGVVSDVLVDLAAGQVALLNVQHADGWQVQPIPAELIYRLGPRTVLMTDSAGLDFSPPPAMDPRWCRTQSLFGLEVLTENGLRLGHVRDAELDPETLAITAYLLRTPPLRRRARIAPREIISCSTELMIVRDRQRGAGPPADGRGSAAGSRSSR